MKTILFPTDFTACADNALNAAIHLCEKLNAKLILFNSFHIPTYSAVPIGEDEQDQLMSSVDNELHALKNKLLTQNKNLQVDCITTYGYTIEDIALTADEKKADLIVMGTKGASGLKEIFAGSNAAQVIEKASCPVLVVPDTAKFNGINKIAFATDFRNSDFDSIIYLIEIAKLFDSKILMVHVSEVALDVKYETDFLKLVKTEIAKKVIGGFENISSHFLIGGNVDYEMEEFIEQNNVDLLSMAMRKRTLLSKLFDESLTKKMACHSHIPLLAFHASKNRI